MKTDWRHKTKRTARAVIGPRLFPRPLASPATASIAPTSLAASLSSASWTNPSRRCDAVGAAAAAADAVAEMADADTTHFDPLAAMTTIERAAAKSAGRLHADPLDPLIAVEKPAAAAAAAAATDDVRDVGRTDGPTFGPLVFSFDGATDNPAARSHVSAASGAAGVAQSTSALMDDDPVSTNPVATSGHAHLPSTGARSIGHASAASAASPYWGRKKIPLARCGWEREPSKGSHPSKQPLAPASRPSSPWAGPSHTNTTMVFLPLRLPSHDESEEAPVMTLPDSTVSQAPVATEHVAVLNSNHPVTTHKGDTVPVAITASGSSGSKRRSEALEGQPVQKRTKII